MSHPQTPSKPVTGDSGAQASPETAAITSGSAKVATGAGPINKDLIGGLIFLALSIGYGVSAQMIPFFPGDEYEPFTARTLPYVLSVLGTVLSLALIVGALREQSKARRQAVQSDSTLQIPQLKPALGNDWTTVIQLIGIMLVYALCLKWMGFIIATTFFLFAGYWVLGERRKKVLFGASLPFVLAFWFALTQLLDIYLAPGQLFALIGFGG